MQKPDCPNFHVFFTSRFFAHLVTLVCLRVVVERTSLCGTNAVFVCWLVTYTTFFLNHFCTRLFEPAKLTGPQFPQVFFNLQNLQ